MVKCLFKMGLIHLIFASDKRGCIGKNNTLPFRLKADMKLFKKLTMNNVIVMGRKTYQSLGKSLQGRENIVLSRNPNFQCDCEVVDGISKDFINRLQNDARDIFIIGGSEIYKLFLPFCDSIYMTLVDTVVENGDSFFGLNEIYSNSGGKNKWKIKPIFSQEKCDNDNQFPFFTFCLYKSENQ